MVLALLYSGTAAALYFAVLKWGEARRRADRLETLVRRRHEWAVRPVVIAVTAPTAADVQRDLDAADRARREVKYDRPTVDNRNPTPSEVRP